MTFAEEKRYDFMKKYGNLILEASNEIEYWDLVLFCLHKEELIKRTDVELIKGFLMDEGGVFTPKYTIPDQKKEKVLIELLEKLFESEWIFRERDNMDYEEDLTTFRRSRIYGVNEEKYVKTFFEDAVKYGVLYAMYRDKCNLLKEKTEPEVHYKKYGKISVFPGGHYCHSPIMDLIVSNVRMIGLMRETPEDLREKVEYDYDKEGRLVMYKYHWPELELNFCEFSLYVEDWLMNIDYNHTGEIESISLRKYKKGLVSEYEYNFIAAWYHPLSGISNEAHREIYKYNEEGILETAIYEDYSFPKLGQNWSQKWQEILRRQKYSFVSDEEDCLKGYWVQRLYGERAAGEPEYVKLCERERKLTKKTRGRWRRPNYFIK